MNATIGKKLEAVCRRQRQQSGLNRAGRMLATAGWVVIGCGVGRWVFDVPMLWIIAASGTLLALPCIGFVGALLGKSDWMQAARQVDRHYGWKDAIATALTNRGGSPIEQQQLAAATRQLAGFRAADVIRFQIPGKTLLRSLPTIAIGTALLLAPNPLELLPAMATVETPTPETPLKTIITRPAAPELTSELVEASVAKQRARADSTVRERVVMPGDGRLVREYFSNEQP